MRNLFVFLTVCSIGTLAIFIGFKRYDIAKQTVANSPFQRVKVPNIGSVEVLNGCGSPKAAAKVADFLRQKRFDVKNIDNAESFNYPNTIIVSKIKDMTIANKIGKSLKTNKIILLREDDFVYNITVFVGSDYGELIQ